MLYQLGPFVDSNHPLIKIGDVDETPLELFRSQIASRLNAVLEDNPATTIILIASVRDMISQHMAFPQAPLDKNDDLGLHKVSRGTSFNCARENGFMESAHAYLPTIA